MGWWGVKEGGGGGGGAGTGRGDCKDIVTNDVIDDYVDDKKIPHLILLACQHSFFRASKPMSGFV